jgi:hypothetical protein
MLVGAFALAVHGYPRATLDMDIWVMPSPENAEAVIRALRRFGAPLHSISSADLQRDDTIFQIGVAPRRIDIITGATGLIFEETYARSESVDVDGLTIRVPSVDDLIINKTASGRLKDLADVEVLKQRRPRD